MVCRFVIENGVSARCEVFFGRGEEVGVSGCGVGFVWINLFFASF